MTLLTFMMLKYTHRLQKLIYLFHEDFSPLLRTNYRSIICPEKWKEIFMKHSVDKHR